MKVLLVIPAYNEEKNIDKLLDKIITACPQYDVLVINDCSRDRTSEICMKRGINVINLPVNLGIGGAVQTGYKYALYNNYDAAVQVDGDGQHDPSYIKLLIEQIENGANLCIGSRFITKEGFQSTTSRRIGIKFFSTLIRMFTGQVITDPTSGFRACDRKVIKLFSREYPRDYPEPESLVNVSRSNLSVSEVPVVMFPREEGKSSISSLKPLYYMIKVSLAIIIASFNKSENTEDKD